MSNIKIFETCETYAFEFLQMMLSGQWKVLPSIIVLIWHILIHILHLNVPIESLTYKVNERNSKHFGKSILFDRQ